MFTSSDDVMRDLNWPQPFNRQDAEIQEMELIYPHVHSKNLYCANIGKGNDLMNYFYVDGRELRNIWYAFDYAHSNGLILV